MMEIQIRAEQCSDSRRIEVPLTQASDSMPYADVLEHSQLTLERLAGLIIAWSRLTIWARSMAASVFRRWGFHG